MGVSVRAVYRRGQLFLLDAIDLAEGQVVDVTIHSGAPQTSYVVEQADARLRLAGVLLDVSTPEDGVELSPGERQQVGALFAGERSSENPIDEERGAY